MDRRHSSTARLLMPVCRPSSLSRRRRLRLLCPEAGTSPTERSRSSRRSQLSVIHSQVTCSAPLAEEPLPVIPLTAQPIFLHVLLTVSSRDRIPLSIIPSSRRNPTTAIRLRHI